MADSERREREREEHEGRERRDQPPHLDDAAAQSLATNPAVMEALLRGLLGRLAIPQAAPPPPPLPPAPRVYVPLIPLITNNSAFHTEHWKKESNFLAFGRHNWDSWNDNLIRSLGLVSPLDRWIVHDRATAGAYWPRPLLTLTSTYEERRNADHWDQNDEATRKLILAVLTHDEARALDATANGSAKALYDALVKRHKSSNELTLFTQWQAAFAVAIDGESAEQWEEAPNAIKRALDRIYAISPPTRNNLEVMLLLHALSGDAEYVQRSLLGDVANGTLTTEAILRRYRTEGERLRLKGQTTAVLAAALASSDPRCGRCAGYGHRRAKCPSPDTWETSSEVRAVPACSSSEVIAALGCKPADSKRPPGPFNALMPRDGTGSPRGRGSSRARGGHRGGGRGGHSYAMIGGMPHGLVEGVLYPVGSSSAPATPAVAAAALEEEAYSDPEAETDGAWMYSMDTVEDTHAPWPSPPVVAADESADWRARDSEEQVYQLSANPDLVAHRGTPSWVLDSGATMHCTPELADLANTRSIAPVTVRGIGGKIVRATRVGDMSHVLPGGKTLTISGVLYIPGVDIRLISLGKLADKGLESRLSAIDAKLVRSTDQVLVATGTRVGHGLYMLDVAASPSAYALHRAAAAVPDDVWHARLGHPAHDHVRRLAKSGAVQGMHLDLSFHPTACQPCIRGKQKATAMPKRRVGEKLGAFMDLVFCDLSGSAERTATPNGEHYSMSLIDDHTSFFWTELLKTKDQAYDEIIAWHARVSRRHNGLVLGCLQIDNGELKSKKLDAWAAALGITVRYTAPHSSAQNGRVERVHQTIASTVRAMRIACDLPETLWGEFTRTASYLRNFRLTTALPSNVTPHESRFGSKPDLSHLREIGCKAFVLIQNVHVTKIQPRSIECILIGYDLHSKAYRCYHRPSRRIITSRNVYFLETHQLTPRPYRIGQSIGAPSPTPTGATPVESWPAAPKVPSPVTPVEHPLAPTPVSHAPAPPATPGSPSVSPATKRPPVTIEDVEDEDDTRPRPKQPSDPSVIIESAEDGEEDVRPGPCRSARERCQP
jgi:hypothetical protein